MRLSSKTRYGTIILMELALNYSKGFSQLGEISRKQGISEKYSEQIINQLKNAKLVLSQRGAQGGYILARSPEQITLKDVVETLEGSLSLIGGFDDYNDAVLGIGKTKYIWKNVSEKIARALAAITLEDLAAEERRQYSIPSYEI